MPDQGIFFCQEKLTDATGQKCPSRIDLDYNDYQLIFNVIQLCFKGVYMSQQKYDFNQKNQNRKPDRDPRLDRQPEKTRTTGREPIGRKPVRRRHGFAFGWLTLVLVLVTAFILVLKVIDPAAEIINDYFPGKTEQIDPADTLPGSAGAPIAEPGSTDVSQPGVIDQTIGPDMHTGQITVILDAGHGGQDSGALAADNQGHTIMESDITLTLSQLVAQNLEAAGLRVIMTRSDQSWVSLYNRIAQTGLLSLDYLESIDPSKLPAANQVTALRKALQIPLDINSDAKDSGGLGFMLGYGVSAQQKMLLDLQKSCDDLLFISIHCNSNNNTDLHGTQVYYCDDETINAEEAEQLAGQTSPAGNQAYVNRDSMRNVLLAEKVYQAITGVTPILGNTNAGKPVLTGNYAVLREQALASILIETAYMSNEADLKILTGSESRQKLADAIGQGIVDYIENRSILA